MLWETEEDLRRLEANDASVREHVKQEARIESPVSEIYEVALQAAWRRRSGKPGAQRGHRRQSP